MRSFSRNLSVVFMALAVASCHDDDDPAAIPLATGLQTVMSAGLEREYFIRIPDDGGDAAPIAVGDSSLPLVIMYHGYSGSYEAWLKEDPEAETF